MNGSTSPPAPRRSAEARGADDTGGIHPQQQHVDDVTASSAATAVRDAPDAPSHVTANGDKPAADDEAESEAETLITSPVKKKEAAKQDIALNAEKPERARVSEGAVANHSEADDEADAAGSSVDEEAAGAGVASMAPKASTEAMDVDPSDDDDSSDPLSEISPGRTSVSRSSSRASSHSRALSEHPRSTHRELDSPNPRKRKHRASSFSLPNKRPSAEGTRRGQRGSHYDDVVTGAIGERSPSPKMRMHRRAVSTQSSFPDVSLDAQSGRKRRSATQLPLNEPKAAKSGWDESSVSSETTSHGQNEQKRPQRGVGRSTSTPGRPIGREHKRHVNKYGFTRLAEACESGDLDLAKEWREKDPEQLEVAEFASNKPLQIAALNGNAEVVEYLIDQGCQLDCANVDKDTPLIDAAENGHLDVVEILLKAGVDPLRQNLKGQQALDVVADDIDNASEIRATLRRAIDRWNSDDAKQRREEEEVQRYRAGPAKELHFMARTYENLVKLVTINDRNGVREFLDARVPVDNAVIAAAARTGDLYLMNMLLAEMTDKKRQQKSEKPMLSVLGTSHFEMVRSLTELEHFNPLWTNRQGKRWSEIAEEKSGPMWKQEVELLKRLEDDAKDNAKNRGSSSPVMRRSDAGGKQRRSGGPKEEEEDGSDDESEEGEPRQRKNGRRLMSRKDLRAAGGKKTDKDSEGSESEMGEGAGESSMRPPASPKEKRGPGRPRTKSAGFKQEDEKDKPAKPHGRRPSSSKLASETALPSVAETMDEDRAEDGIEDGDANAPPNTSSRSSSVHSEDRRKQEEEAKAKQAEEDSRKAQEQLRAEEARKAGEVRQEEEERQRQAQEQARREEEQKRALEEEEQRKKEKELTEAKSNARARLLASLPRTLSWVLDDKSDFSFNERGARDTILEKFAPLQIVWSPAPFANGQLHAFVSNILAAPFLGKDAGLQLLFPDDSPEFEGSLAQTLPSVPVLDEEKQHLLSLLSDCEFAKASVDADKHAIDANSSFRDDLERAAAHCRHARESTESLRSGSFVLRWVSLQAVLNELHPAFRDTDIGAREDWRAALGQARRTDALGVKVPGGVDFYAAVKSLWGVASIPPASRFGESVGGPFRRRVVGTTAVTVSHEK